MDQSSGPSCQSLWDHAIVQTYREFSSCGRMSSSGSQWPLSLRLFRLICFCSWELSSSFCFTLLSVPSSSLTAFPGHQTSQKNTPPSTTRLASSLPPCHWITSAFCLTSADKNTLKQGNAWLYTQSHARDLCSQMLHVAGHGFVCKMLQEELQSALLLTVPPINNHGLECCDISQTKLAYIVGTKCISDCIILATIRVHVSVYG